MFTGQRRSEYLICQHHAHTPLPHVQGVADVEKHGEPRLDSLPLRAGLATSAAAAGKSERAIMNQTGHRSVTTVRRYIRDGNLFRENAAEKIGL
jgi:hypothetical protein